MSRLSLSLFFILVPLTAIAEVCDKVVGERWQSEDGPIRLFLDVTSTAPWLVVIAVVFALSTYSRVITWLAAALAGFLALIFASDWWENHEIIQAAYREGSVSAFSILLQTTVMAVLALLFLMAPRLRSLVTRTA
jgi:hypothetical protein